VKIVIVKTSALGDIVHLYPTLHFLRRKFPNAQIDWAVEKKNSTLVASHPEVNRTLCFSRESLRELKAFRDSLRETEYDVLFDFQGNCKSALIALMARAKQKAGFSWRTVAEWPNLFATTHRFDPPPGRNIREDYLYLAESFFKEKSYCSNSDVVLKGGEPPPSRRNVVVAPFSAWKNKEITEEALVEFLKLLQKKLGSRLLFLWGSDAEKGRAERVRSFFPEGAELLPKLSFPDLQRVLEEAKLVVAMDSLPLHLAATTSTPTYSFFGPTNPDKYAPFGENHGYFRGSCPYGKSFEKRCPILRRCETGACLRSYTGEQLFAHFERWKDSPYWE